MSLPTLIACPAPSLPHWQLGQLPPASGEMWLVAWPEIAQSAGGGVPPVVARVLVQALTHVAMVSFLTTSPSAGGRWLESGPWPARLGDWLRERPHRFALQSTNVADVAEQLFQEPWFNWALQGQIILLSNPDQPPPLIARQTLLDLLAHGTASPFPPGIAALLRPGVDGAMIGMHFLSDGMRAALLLALEKACAVAGIGWRIGQEAELMA